MSFSKDQTNELAKPLDRKNVKSRSGAGNRQLSFVEGWHAIAEANRIFGFGGWTSETLQMQCVCMEGTVSYTAKVRVTVEGISREGWGAGHGRAGSIGDKHESAVKEAETDARKRALMTFGNQFGLALYDKEQANVEDNSADKSTPAKPEPSAEYKRQVATKAEMDKDPLFRWTHRIAQLDAATDWPKVEVHIRQSKEFNHDQREQLLKKLAEAKARAVEFSNVKS